VEAFSVTPANTKGTNPDGSVRIKCRLCGRHIINAMYRGFSTVTCSECQGKPIPEPEKFEGGVLYDNPAVEKVGLAKAVFRALGFGRPKPPKAPTTESQKVVREKKRKPLFGPEDKE